MLDFKNPEQTVEKTCRLCKNYFITTYQGQDICDNCMKRRKLEMEQPALDEDEFKEMPLDRIETHTTAKGLLQASIKFHSKIEDMDSVKRLIERQKYAWDKLRETFPNLVWATKGESEEE